MWFPQSPHTIVGSMIWDRGNNQLGGWAYTLFGCNQSHPISICWVIPTKSHSIRLCSVAGSSSPNQASLDLDIVVVNTISIVFLGTPETKIAHIRVHKNHTKLSHALLTKEFLLLSLFYYSELCQIPAE